MRHDENEDNESVHRTLKVLMWLCAFVAMAALSLAGLWLLW